MNPVRRYAPLLLVASLALGAGLAAIQPGISWKAWLGFAALLFVGLAGLLAVWRWAGGGTALAWMVGAALVLRLAAGVGAYLALPANGYDEPDDRAGYVFTDAHRRDAQAWELAQSGKSLLAAFDKSYYTDQYGGLLALSALTYKIFSPDAHRPLIIILLAALSAAAGVPFLLRASALLWSDRLATVATWMAVLYPESILTGGAQMREPFLLTFIALALWGFADWLCRGRHNGWVWVAGGLFGMVLVSPGIGLASLALLGGWIWFRGERRRLPLWVAAAAVVVTVLAVAFLAWSLGRQHDFSAASPIGVILNWFRGSVKWVIYELERGSGQIQNVFSKMNPLAQFFFVIGYGIAQPVLPPAFFEPTTLTWHIIAVLRSLGWYVLLPLLLYAPFAAWHDRDVREKRTWAWLAAFAWGWIVVCAVRAGGDQWDNPRYRLIFLGIQSLLGAYAWVSWKDHKSAWLPRIVALEVLCVVLFGQWYVARYYLIGIHLPILVVLSLSLGSVLAIFLGGWLWDRLHRRQQAG